MNYIDIQDEDFALTVESLRYFQEAWNSLNVISRLGGSKYILAGCVVTGGSVGNGVVVIDGEVLEFRGGVAGTSVIIREESVTVNVDTGSYTTVTRWVEFGVSSSQIAWSEIERIPRNSNVLSLSKDVRDILNGFSYGWESLILSGVIAVDNQTGGQSENVYDISAGRVYIDGVVYEYVGELDVVRDPVNNLGFWKLSTSNVLSYVFASSKPSTGPGIKGYYEADFNDQRLKPIV